MAILAKGGEFAPAVIFLIVTEARMSVFTFLYIAIFNRTLRIDMSKLAFSPKFTEAKFVVLADVINHFLIFSWEPALETLMSMDRVMLLR